MLENDEAEDDDIYHVRIDFFDQTSEEYFFTLEEYKRYSQIDDGKDIHKMNITVIRAEKNSNMN